MGRGELGERRGLRGRRNWGEEGAEGERAEGEGGTGGRRGLRGRGEEGGREQEGGGNWGPPNMLSSWWLRGYQQQFWILKPRLHHVCPHAMPPKHTPTSVQSLQPPLSSAAYAGLPSLARGGPTPSVGAAGLGSPEARRPFVFAGTYSPWDLGLSAGCARQGTPRTWRSRMSWPHLCWRRLLLMEVRL